MPVVRRGAERVLVVGSSASVPTGTGASKNALQLAARYVDVSVSGLVETELAQSQSYVHGHRLAENDACHDALEDQALFPAVCGDGCDRDALCEGRWEQVCTDGQRASSTRSPPIRPTLDERLLPVWKMVTIFRNERRVEPLTGYTFDPKEQRRLFLAGAEAARIACLSIAKLLGVPVPDDPRAELRRKLVAWCAPALPADLCGSKTASMSPRNCQGDVPPPSAEMTRDCRAGATP
jgi:hypothetical protein